MTLYYYALNFLRSRKFLTALRNPLSALPVKRLCRNVILRR
jgi:hypothetical protein